MLSFRRKMAFDPTRLIWVLPKYPRMGIGNPYDVSTPSVTRKCGGRPAAFLSFGARTLGPYTEPSLRYPEPQRAA